MSTQLNFENDLILNGLGMTAEHFVQMTVNTTGKDIVALPFLRRMGMGVAPKAVWDMWAVQRYKASAGFIPFLESLRDKADNAGLIRVSETVGHNIADEKGISKTTGKPLKTGSHEDWRLDFYGQLGITVEQLQNNPSLAGSQNLKTVSQDIIDNADVWEHLGALIELEMWVPMEFGPIKYGLENTPALRPLFYGDDERQCRKARLYIEHHQDHDLFQHAPEIFFAHIRDTVGAPVSKSSSTLGLKSNFSLIDTMQRMAKGGKRLKEARIGFYTSLEQEALRLFPDLPPATMEDLNGFLKRDSLERAGQEGLTPTSLQAL